VTVDIIDVASGKSRHAFPIDGPGVWSNGSSETRGTRWQKARAEFEELGFLVQQQPDQPLVTASEGKRVATPIPDHLVWTTAIQSASFSGSLFVQWVAIDSYFIYWRSAAQPIGSAVVSLGKLPSMACGNYSEPPTDNQFSVLEHRNQRAILLLHEGPGCEPKLYVVTVKSEKPQILPADCDWNSALKRKP